jgi:ClpP class serine protease
VVGIGYSLARIIHPLFTPNPSVVVFDCEVLSFAQSRMMAGENLNDVIASWNMRLVEFAEAVSGDDRVRAVLIKLPMFNIIGVKPCQMYESIKKMRDAGKEVHVYLENDMSCMTTAGWAALLVADRVHVAPNCKDLIAITPPLQVYSVKRFYANRLIDVLALRSRRTFAKDFVAPFREDEPSPARIQRSADILEKLIAVWTEMMLASPDISIIHIEQIIKRGIVSCHDYVRWGMVSTNSYEDLLKWLTGRYNGPTIQSDAYLKALPRSRKPPSIMVLSVQGPVQPRRGMGAVGIDLEWINTCVDRIIQNPAVRVVVVDISGPGGSVTLSHALHHSLSRLKKAGKRLLVLCTEPAAASADYWIACAATRGDIYATRGCIVGSIGVGSIRMSDNLQARMSGTSIVSIWKGLMSNYYDIKSFSKEQISFLQDSIEGIYYEFRQHVAASRRLSGVQMDRVATGEVFMAEEAERLGLVDRVVWGMHEVLHDARCIVGDQSASVGYCTRPSHAPGYAAIAILYSARHEVPDLHSIAQKLSQASKLSLQDGDVIITEKKPGIFYQI